MPPRPCIVCGTPVVSTSSRCAQHQRPRNRDPQHRADHKRARAQLAPLVARGIDCTRCGQPIHPDQPWDADRRPWGYEPAHAHCNRAAGARRQA
jgi:hypothetical protein